MKKLYLMFCAAAAALTLNAAESVPYFTELGAGCGWQTYDVNADGKTWTSSTDGTTVTGTKNSIKISYNTKLAMDDWYVSPALHLEAGKEYKTKIWYKCSASYAEKFGLYYSTGDTPEALSEGVEVYSLEIKTGNWTQQVTTFNVAETGDYYFGIHGFSDMNQLTLYLTGFSISENAFFPNTVSGLKVTPGEDRALTADLEWTLPTTDADGVALPEDAVFDAVTIYRDGMEVDVLDGTATSWTDSARTGLTSGYHTYEVMVTVNGANSAKAKVESKYIGPVAPEELPYTLDFPNYNQEKFELFWTPVKGRNSTSTANWQYAASTYYGNRFSYYPGSGKTEDDWLISPEMNFATAGVYKLTLTLAYTNADTNIDVLLGTGNSIGGYEDVIGNIGKLTSSAEDYVVYINITEPGVYGIALHNQGYSGSYSTYYLSGFKVESWKILPAQVTDLKTEVAGDNVTLTWTNPSLSNIGEALAGLTKVEVYGDDELLHTYDSPVVGAEMSYVDENPDAGVHTYYVIAYNNEGAADGTIVKVTSSWVGDETQPLPYVTEFASTDVTRPIWSSYDANGDDFTWRIGSSAKMDRNSASSFYSNNDYLLSPYMDLQAGYYKVSTTLKGGARYKAFGVGTVSDKNDVVATYKELGEFKQTGVYAITYDVMVKVEEAGKYAFAIYNRDYVSTSSESADEVTKFAVEYVPVVPELATDITVTPAADLSLQATISWKNPTATNIEGVAASDLVKAIVKRNGETVGEVTEGLVPGEETVFVDNTVPGAGTYKYSVEIYNEEGCSAKAAPEVTSSWIGGGLTLPFTCDESFNASDWKVYNVNGDKRSEAVGGGDITWEIESSYMNITSSNNVPNDWAITPRLTLEDGMIYELSVSSYTGNGYDPINWDLYLGTTDHYDSMTRKIATIYTERMYKASAQVDKIRIRVSAQAESEPAMLADDEESMPEIVCTPGVYTIGLHANNKGAVSVNKFIVSQGISTGVDSVIADADVEVIDNVVYFGNEVAEIKVYDMSGRMVDFISKGSEVSLKQLTAGIYFVTANNGSIRIKVAVK